ncbi:MAG: radical SAM protein [Deltaproteobacteria bacterium]|jgi:hypothetical protein|nr:radical SAM protein [Deltaproteobacteria bacterium]
MKKTPPNSLFVVQSRQDPNATLGRILGPEFLTYRQAFALAEKGQRPDFPPHLDVDVTTVCQLRCPMCPAGGKNSPFPGFGLFLPLATYLKALREAERRSLPSLRLGMTGEPLLVKDISHWVKLAKDYGVIDVALITNGQLLTAEMSQKLIQAGLTRLMISVDAASFETYKIVRPGGDWERLLDNIGSFLAIRKALNSPLPLLRLSFVEMTLNVSEREAFATKFGPLADYLVFQKYQNILASPTHNWGLGSVEPGICLEPRARLALHANGGLFPCCGDFGRLEPLGYFPENSLREIWLSTPALNLAHGQNRAACLKCQKGASLMEPTPALNAANLSVPKEANLNLSPGPKNGPYELGPGREINHADSVLG